MIVVVCILFKTNCKMKRSPKLIVRNTPTKLDTLEL